MAIAIAGGPFVALPFPRATRPAPAAIRTRSVNTQVSAPEDGRRLAVPPAYNASRRTTEARRYSSKKECQAIDWTDFEMIGFALPFKLMA
ncbi:MAG: hypothetical protein ABIH86_06285 [Planctomycetota bacterium]